MRPVSRAVVPPHPFPTGVLILCVFLGGCFSPPAPVERGPAVFYVVPEWKGAASRRDARIPLLVPLGAVLVYEKPPASSPPGCIVLSFPSRPLLRKLPGLRLLFIPRGNTAPLPPGTGRSVEHGGTPLVILLKGPCPPGILSRICRRFRPCLCIVVQDHYEQKDPAEGVPVFATGTRTLSSPLTGDFPHILRVRVTAAGEGSARPVDEEGYILKPDIVTPAVFKGIRILDGIFSTPVTVKEWDTFPVRVTKTYTITNPFSLPLSVSFHAPHAAGGAEAAVTPAACTLPPGGRTRVAVRFTVPSLAAARRPVEIAYTTRLRGLVLHRHRARIRFAVLRSPGK